jgi:hypothetical protein
MVASAINRTGRRHSVAGCVGRMAQEFGDHPDAAAERMRWARRLAAQVATGRTHAAMPRCGQLLSTTAEIDRLASTGGQFPGAADSFKASRRSAAFAMLGRRHDRDRRVLLLVAIAAKCALASARVG